jgi:crossover junction endodeoxyribonuclease RuvC
MLPVVVGVDPGLRGGIVALRGNEVLMAECMPTLQVGKSKKIVDVVTFAHRLEGVGPTVVAIEAQQSMPGQGLSSTFKTGRGFGQLEGVCYGLRIRFEVPRATAWTKTILKGVAGEGKQRGISFIQRRLPHLDLSPGALRVPHDGIADAACIALWMQQKLLSETTIQKVAVNPFAGI